MSFISWQRFLCFTIFFTTAWSANNSSAQTGTALTDDDLAQLKPGTTKEQVIKKYGTPTFQCLTINRHNVCYFHQSQDGKSDQQKQVEMEFDENGELKTVRVYAAPGSSTSSSSEKKS